MQRGFSSELHKSVIEYLLTGEIPKQLSKGAKARFKKKFTKDKWKVISTKIPDPDPSVQNPIVSHVLLYVSDDGVEKPVVQSHQVQTVLQKMYDNPLQTTNGIKRFYSKVASKYYGISRSTVEDFLKKQEAYQLHKPFVREKVIKPIVVSAPYKYWQADTIQFPNLSRFNRGYTKALTIIDLFTKFAWVFPLLSGTAEEILEKFEGLWNAGIKPSVLQTDNGTEFKNSKMTKAAAKAGVKILHSRAHTPQSQGAIERFNQTFKRSIQAYMTHQKTNNWVDAATIITANYNTTLHTTIGMTPTEALQESNRQRVTDATYKKLQRIHQKTKGVLAEKIAKGDTVRVAKVYSDPQVAKQKESGVGYRGYLKQWDTATRKVEKVLRSTKGSPIQKETFFYKVEGFEKLLPRAALQKVNGVVKAELLPPLPHFDEGKVPVKAVQKKLARAPKQLPSQDQLHDPNLGRGKREKKKKVNFE